MPAIYDLPPYTGAYDQQNVDLYNKLPFYLASMQAKRQPTWDTYNQLWGKIPWQANMGPILKGVEAVHTPIGRQMFYPQALQAMANKDVFVALERTEQTNLTHHKFESPQLNFLPSFQDFRENQVDFTHDDIVRQMTVANDQFIRTVMFQKSPILYISGNTAPDAQLMGNSELSAAPYIAAGTDVAAGVAAGGGKTAAYLLGAIAKIGGTPGIGLSTIDRAVMTLRDDLGAPFFEGTVNRPKDNELVKGKYVIVGSAEAYQNLKWDPNLDKFRDVNWNIVIDGFHGSIFGMITWKFERYPIRIAANGTMPVPEIQDASGDTVPNPAYNNAPNEICWALGADAYKTIKVGPPPRKFASGGMSESDFQALNWNGEVKLTRNILLKYADGTIDTNKYGEFLQFISYLVMGCLPVRPRNAIPILFRRGRPAPANV